MNSLRVFSALLMVPWLAPRAATADQSPPFVYYVLPGNEALGERLKSLDLQRLLLPLACAGGACRPLVQAATLEPTRAGRFVSLRVVFDDWDLSVTSEMYDAKPGATGKFEFGPKTFSIYSSDCSRMHRDDPDACLQQELASAFERIASYWEARLDPALGKVVAAQLADREQLPLATSLLAKVDAPCRIRYTGYRLVKDFGDYFWLAFPPEYSHGDEGIVIQSRCGAVS